jgi:hypothetical protein
MGESAFLRNHLVIEDLCALREVDCVVAALLAMTTGEED